MRLLFWLLTAAYATFLAVMTHLPPRKLPDIHVNDKLEHLGAYGLLAGALFCSLWASGVSVRRTAGLTAVIGLAYGALDELTQPPFGRSCELNDWLADATGITIAVVCMTVIRTVVITRRRDARSPAGSPEARPAGRG